MEAGLYLKFLAALVFVVGLIGLLAWLVRRFGLGGQLMANPGKVRRLGVVEVSVLDARRKLVLLRRDQVEHLVLLGPGQDLLLESGIEGNASTRPIPDVEATERVP